MHLGSTERLHALDNLRALAMLAGVLFHAALAHSPLVQPFFPTADRAQSVLLDVLIWFLHLFRMPLFFAIAGYFAAVLIERKGLGGLFRDRLRRVALPFVLLWPITYLTMAWSTGYAAAHVAHPSPMLRFINAAQAANLPAPPPGTGHLWFLYYLLLFYVLLWIVRTLLPAHGCLVPRGRATGTVALLIGLPLLLIPALASVSAPHPAPESVLPQFWALMFFGAFFVLGYQARRHGALLERCRAHAWGLAVAGLLMYAMFYLALRAQPPSLKAPTASWLQAASSAFVSVWMTLACLGLGQRLLAVRHRLLRYLADASYWVYVAHLPVLLAVQYALMDFVWPWPAKLLVAVSATMSVCLLSFNGLIRDTWVGTWLLGRAAPAATRPSRALAGDRA